MNNFGLLKNICMFLFFVCNYMTFSY